VYGEEQQPEHTVLLAVLDCPREGHEGKRSVQGYSQEHGEGAQSVQVVSARGFAGGRCWGIVFGDGGIFQVALWRR
jgi:hypothetical protein